MKPVTIHVYTLLLSTNILAAQWAVIVAGSNTFSNYRHQADTCHAYQIMTKHGIPAANIIHFAYDDIAHNAQNKFPGKIFNKPNGNDVYAGCNIDYKGALVTPTNFLAVIKGQETAVVKKTLKSTADDTVFINFADHGAPGLIAFPNGQLYATDFNKALVQMNQQKMYKQMVIYIEACESGSMFPALPKDINIYAATAANANESSWGFYCPPDDVVKDIHVGSCLGDTFSISWMEDTDLGTAEETLQAQFTNVVKRTTKSHPMQFGDLSITKALLSDWLGPQKTIKPVGELEKPINRDSMQQVNSRDNNLHYLIWKHAREMTQESMQELNNEIISRKNFDELFSQVGSLSIRSTKNGVRAELNSFENPDDADFEEWDCYKLLNKSFETKCGKWSDYGMKYHRQFYNLCYLVGGLKSNGTTIRDTMEIMDKFCAEERLF